MCGQCYILVEYVSLAGGVRDWTNRPVASGATITHGVGGTPGELSLSVNMVNIL